jgi:hypothetical protein
MHKDDMARLELSEGKSVVVTTESDDRVRREVHGLRVTVYDVPKRRGSKTAAVNSIPVRVRLPK